MEWAFSFSPIHHLVDYNSDKKKSSTLPSVMVIYDLNSNLIY